MYVGKRIRRIEDKKLITGNGRFIDDITIPGTLYAYFIRSSRPHAKLKLECNNCFFGKNFPPEVGIPLEETSYVGEPIAVVLGESYYKALDLAEKANIDYDELPYVIDAEKALGDDPKVRNDLRTNVLHSEELISGEPDKRDGAVISGVLVNQRVIPAAMETRGAIAYFDGKRLTVYSTTQSAHLTRKDLMEVLSRYVDDIRVIQPDVGGAFGSKIISYPELFAISYLSIMLKRPIKWVNTRRDDMISTSHGRDMKLKFSAKFLNGKINALEGELIVDAGAPYTRANSEAIDMGLIAARMIPGVYNLKDIKINLKVVNTNKTFISPYRGAGRPEASYFIERIMSIASKELSIDQMKIRENNLIENPGKIRNAFGITYDSGNYKAILEMAIPIHKQMIIRRDEMRRNGILAGVGLSFSIEICAFGWETAKVMVKEDGKVVVVSGSGPHGQGDGTAFAQIAADELSIPVENIEVIYGDTDVISSGTLTAGSKTVTIGGSAVKEASVKLREKMIRAAGEIMGSDASSIELREGKFIDVKTGKSVTFREVAEKAYNIGYILEENSIYTIDKYTSPYSIHLALLEVDKETGFIKVHDYRAIDDVGVIINPMLAEGQVHGGIAQGLGQALLEEVLYSEGVPVNADMGQYYIPSSLETFNVSWITLQMAKSDTPLRSKGIGELPTITSTPAIVNAVEDAIGKRIDKIPLRPDYILQLIE